MADWVLRKIIDEYAEAPAAYALDVGLTKDGKAVIVEVNDGYSLGCYGLDPLHYAKLNMNYRLPIENEKRW